MASTVFEISLRVIVFSLTVAIGTFPVCADQESCNAATTCKVGKEKSIVKTTVTASPFFESEEGDFSEYELDVRNNVEIKCLNSEMKTDPACSSAEEAAADCELVGAEQLSMETAMSAALLAVRHSCHNLTQAAITFIRARMVPVMLSQGWADARRYHPEYFIEVYRLLPEAPAVNSTSAAVDSQTTSKAESQTPVTVAPEVRPTTEAQSQPRSEHTQTPAATTTLPDHATTPDDLVSLLSRLPAEEKGRQLIQAAREGAVKKLQALLAAGADVRVMDGNNNTVLHLAAFRGDVQVVEILLKFGVEVDPTNVMKATPLHYAARWGHAAVVRLLAAHSAEVNARNRELWTPLHYAARWGEADAAEALLEAGADRRATTNDGDTPLDLAREYDQQELVDILT